MYCKDCGQRIVDGSVFCPVCGSFQKEETRSSYENNQQGNGYSYGTGQQTGYANMEISNRVGRKENYTFGEAVKSFFANYANFSGRATISEYWWAWLFNALLNLILGYIPVIGWIVMLATFIPGLSLSVRRLHDRGKSGWFLLWGLLPLVGWIIVIVQYFKASVGDNQWGPGPSSW